MATGFYPEANLLGNVGQNVMDLVITNSATIAVGDMVKTRPGTVNTIELAGATYNILGRVEGFIDADGRPGSASPDIVFAATTVPDTLTVDSDNETVDYVRARVLVTPYVIYANNPNATIGTTLGSNIFGYFSDIVSASDQVDESGAQTGVAQMFIYGTRPNDTASGTLGLYLIHESQMFVYSA